ncbi:adenylate/guanylate cyclase domain-containing protein [Actinocorallia sp. API 0066]|uniref:adenylate/guanylate cyclase domain-containing protein n=1 Tax=Actinocorallia sp. API 0066 TaxID=2896846 RepID=UPI001E2A6AB7|nr:adenylate/guanylate cyclase domain-containing protein [Actinocorallia sp. API 0066]MCD0452329.1 adenylate/guanylate cyclase domain-containing protein [Actinocorallia sp. API 0066]
MNRDQIAHNLDSLGAKLANIPGAPRSLLEIRVRWLLMTAVLGANAVGAAVVLVFVLVVLPNPEEVERLYPNADLVNVIAFVSYPVVAVPIAMWWALKLFAPLRRLVREQTTNPDREQRHSVLLGPARLSLIQAVLWIVGATGWTILNAFYGPLMALKMGMTCLLGGITTIVLVYLMTERLLRPAAALVLATKPPREHLFSRVRTRAMLTWALGTAVPMLGLIVIAIVALTDPDFDAFEAGLSSLVLGCVALFISFQVTWWASQAIGDPVRTVREGMARVSRGDLDTEISVFDASELGQLQAGFNTMVAGLRAHERLQDLFSRHVGSDVAELALNSDISLGGETQEVAVLFVDLAGSTRMAAERPPDEVVALLNLFFGVVVDCVNRNGGWINKFEGDAALAIFGAPAELDLAGGHALAAGREMAVELRARVPELTAGIGVSRGAVVAGYIGAEQRFEYTVIGDPVNEAARLSDLAKTAPGRVLASAQVLADADELERFRWETGQTITLRGRPRPTVLVHPLVPVDPEAPLPEFVARARGLRRRRRILPLLPLLRPPRREGDGKLSTGR